MKFRTIIYLIAGIAVLAYCYWEVDPFVASPSEVPADSDSVAVEKVDFKARDLQEKFVSETEFKTSSELQIPLSSGEVVTQSVLGGEKIKTCVLGFVIKRADSSLYTLFVHLPGDKTAKWNDKTFEYRYQSHKMPIKFVSNH